MFEHHANRGNGSYRVCNVLACDIGCRSVNRFIQSCAATDCSGGKHSEAANQNAAFVAENISEDIVRYDDIETFRLEDELHGAVVHIEMIQSDIREFLRDG